MIRWNQNPSNGDYYRMRIQINPLLSRFFVWNETIWISLTPTITSDIIDGINVDVLTITNPGGMTVVNLIKPQNTQNQSWSNDAISVPYSINSVFDFKIVFNSTNSTFSYQNIQEIPVSLVNMIRWHQNPSNQNFYRMRIQMNSVLSNSKFWVWNETNWILLTPTITSDTIDGINIDVLTITNPGGMTILNLIKPQNTPNQSWSNGAISTTYLNDSVFDFNIVFNSINSTFSYENTTEVFIPDKPTILSSIPASQKVNLNLSPPQNTGNAPIIGYKIELRNSNDQLIGEHILTNNTSQEISGLTNGTIYKFSIFTKNDFDESTESNQFVRIPYDGINSNNLLTILNLYRQNQNTVFSDVNIQKDFIKNNIKPFNNTVIPSGSGFYSGTNYLRNIVSGTTDNTTIFKSPEYSDLQSSIIYNINGGGTAIINQSSTLTFAESDVNTYSYFFMIPNEGRLIITDNTNTLIFIKYNDNVYQIQNNVATQITTNISRTFILGSIIFTLKGIGSISTNVNIMGNQICYLGESKVLTQDTETGEIAEVCVKDITPEKYLVYSITQQKFIPIKINCISGQTEKFILIKKDLLGENKPSEDFYVTPSHPILVKNNEIKARNIIGGKKVVLNKQYIYSLVTDYRDALAINNIDVICWKYDEFIEKYNKTEKTVWIENKNMNIIQRF